MYSKKLIGSIVVSAALIGGSTVFLAKQGKNLAKKGFYLNKLSIKKQKSFDLDCYVKSVGLNYAELIMIDDSIDNFPIILGQQFGIVTSGIPIESFDSEDYVKLKTGTTVVVSFNDAVLLNSDVWLTNKTIDKIKVKN